MDALLDKNFGGLALLLVASSIFSVLYPRDKGYKVTAHPVNQAGTSSRQMSDLDITASDGTPVLAVELKDKPFTATEVSKAARHAHECGAPSMLFIAGRSGLLDDDAHRYFNDAKREFEDKGMLVGVMGIDALLDFFFATHHDVDAPFLLAGMQETMAKVHATPEAISWIYHNYA